MTTPYVTPQALIDAFGEREIVDLTDRADQRTYAVDMAVAQRACDRASVEVDASLALRYRLPLDVVPELLHYLALDLARFYLHDTEPPALVKTRFDAARATLRELSAGRQSLGVDLAGANVEGRAGDLAELATSDASGAKDWARAAW